MNSKLPQDLQELFALLDASERGVTRRKPSPRTTARVEEIRKRIPKLVLEHFDRIMQRGRKPIAPVEYAICTACNLQISKSHALAVHRSGEIGICDNCGAFIYVERSDRLGSE
jgi:predicted  nucleic acid-binding Zn-ribbon protein